MARLFMIKGPMQGHAFDLKDEITCIGRAFDNDIQIDDPSISRKHAKIFRQGEGLLIEDLQSHNGTLIDGQSIHPFHATELRQGISISMGNILFILGQGSVKKAPEAQVSIDVSGRREEKTRKQPNDQTLVTDRKNLELVSEISGALMRSLNPDEICEKIMDTLFLHFVRIDAGYILLHNRETGKVKEILSRTRDKKRRHSTTYSRSVVERVLREGKAVMISDTRRENDSKVSETMEVKRIRSIMCVPLIARSKVRGVIYVHSINLPQGFEKKDLSLFAAISTPAAVALENARLFSESKRAEEALRKARDELEKRVQERTRELVLANEKLLREAAEKKRSEEDLRESEERYRDLFENANDLIQIVAPDGSIRYVNRAWRDTLGYSEEEIPQLTMFDVMAPECKDQCLQVVRDVLSGKESSFIEAVFLTKEGNPVMVEGTINGRFQTGQPVSTRAILRDVTERKKAEESLQISEERFRNMAASAQDAVISLDNEGHVSYWNKAAESMFQYREEEVLGKEIHDIIVPPKYGKEVRQGFEAWKVTGEGPFLRKTRELTACKKDGTEFPVELSLASVQVRGQWNAVGMVRDITERKRADEELRQKTFDLDARVKQLDCLYGISRLQEKQGASLDDFLGGVAELIPSSMEYPEIATSRITIDNRAYPSSNFHESQWKIFAPILCSGHQVGLLEVFYSELGADRGSDGPFRQEEKTLLTLLSEQIGKAIDHKRSREALAMAREREMEIGSRIQETLLLGHPPEKVPGLSVAAMTVPSLRTDGDFYDFFTQSDQCMDVLIGDVMGKGVPAALLGAAMKSHFLRALSDLIPTSETFPKPSAIVRLVHQRMVKELIGLESFVTLCYARFDLVGRHAELVDCGHTRTIHFHQTTQTCNTIKGYNMPLGFSEDESYSPLSFPVEPGDILFFYSDGVSEARNEAGDFFGEDRLIECIIGNAQLNAEALIAEVRSSVLSFSRAETLSDDLTCVVVKIEADSHRMPLLRLELEIPSSTGQLSKLRDFVQDLCQRNIKPPLDMDNTWQLGLAANEAATNIMKHSYRGQKDRKIHIVAEAFVDRIILHLNHWGEAFDPPNFLEPPPAEGVPESGYGLFLISTYVDDVSYIKDPDGMNSIILMKKRNKA